jgi:hypothetical protein
MRDLRQDELDHISGAGRNHGEDYHNNHKASRTDKKNDSQKHAHNSNRKNVKSA